MSDISDPLMSVSAAARAVGVDQSTLAKQVRQGLVRSHDGKVRLSEVLADRAANIDLGRAKRRDGAIDQPAANAKAARAAAPTVEPDGDEDDEAGPDDGAVIIDGVTYSYADARAMKETYLAKLKQLEFETKQGKLGLVDDMLADNQRILVTVRERLLAIPGKLGGDLDRAQVERVRDELYEAMEELYAEAAAAEAAFAERDEADDGDDGAEAAAPLEPRRVGGAVPVRRAKDQRRPG